MTPKQIKFTQTYFANGGKASEAYRASYDAANMADCSVSNAASEVLRHPLVAEYLEELYEQAASQAKLSVSWVLQRYMEIATADVNELVKSRQVCCRYCHGMDHKYQWIDAEEWAKAVAEVIEANRKIEIANKKRPEDEKAPLKDVPDYAGGFGFWGTAYPSETCPKCFGKGQTDILLQDTTKLSKAGKMLYGGIKMTSTGPEIKLRDQDGALDWLAKYLGMDKKTMELSGPGGGPLVHSHMKAEELTDDQLAALIAQPPATDE